MTTPGDRIRIRQLPSPVDAARRLPEQIEAAAAAFGAFSAAWLDGGRYDPFKGWKKL